MKRKKANNYFPGYRKNRAEIIRPVFLALLSVGFFAADNRFCQTLTSLCMLTSFR